LAYSDATGFRILEHVDSEKVLDTAGFEHLGCGIENPHCGNCGVPFMYNTTEFLVTWSRMVSWMLMGLLR
jgi:hypothetical protein